MKSKFKKLMAAALVLCLMLALLPAGVLANSEAGAGDAPTLEAPVNEGGGAGDPSQPGGVLPEGSEPEGLGGGPYSVTVDYDNNKGTCTITGVDEDGKANVDTKITITVKAKEGYGFESIKKGNQPQSVTVKPDRSEATHTFTMPSENVEFSVSFLPIHKVSFSDYNEGKYTVGNVTPTDLKTYDCLSLEGKEFDFSVEAKDGYYIESVGSTDADITQDKTSGLYKFTTPAKNVLVNVNVGQYKTHSISVDNTFYTHGSISVEHSAYNTQEVKVYVTPDPGYKLTRLYYLQAMARADAIEININGSQPYTFKMPDHDIVLFAEFAETTYNISANSPTNGKVSFTVNGDTSATADYRDQIVVTVDPDGGYYLTSLTINDEEVSYWVNWNWHWNYDGTGTYTFNMPAKDVEIEAEFTNQLRIDTNYNGYRGEVEVLVEDGETNFADRGDWVAFKPVAYTGFNIGAISVTGNWTGRSYDVETWYWHNGWYYFRMPSENVTINVEFTDNSHAVNVKDASNGTLKTNTKWAVEDERVYITAVPDKGYELTWLSVKAEDGTRVDVFEAIKEDTYYFFMPDQAVTVSAIFAYDYPDMPFTDVNSNSWYFNAIEFVYNKGIMQGVSSTKFSPNGTVTRGMLVTMLWRMAGEPYVGGGSFDDVASGSYYATAVAWAAKNGIVDGYNSTRFGPNDAVTREQIATMLYRYAKWLGYSTSGSSLAGYSDASSVSSWAKDAMGWAVKNSVVTGVTATKLNPASSATRAETAQMFMNFYEYLN